MINNRQAGRRRGRGGNNGSGNGPRPNGGGQRDNGNRIDSRARGNASQLYEKYKNLAADAQRQGDRVNTEYYLQFADHYFRVLSEARSRFEEQNQQNQQGGQPRRQRDDGMDAQPFVGSFDAGFDGQDDDYADEGEPIRPGEQAFGDDRGNRHASAQPPRRDERPRDDRPRDDQPREARPRNDDQPREYRARNDQRRGDQSGEQRRDDQQGDDRGPREFVREQAPAAQIPSRQAAAEEGEGFVRRPRRQRDDRASAAAQPADEAPAPIEVAVTADVPGTAVETAGEAEAPRRRGRPRRERPVEEAPAAFDASLLPPALGASLPSASESVAAGSDDAEEKPRRRRVRTTPAPKETQAS